MSGEARGFNDRRDPGSTLARRAALRPGTQRFLLRELKTLRRSAMLSREQLNWKERFYQPE